MNLPSHSPHKFRHGHAVYGMQHAKDIGDLKALSQNLMHDSLQVTDKVYGILSMLDVKERITQLGSNEFERPPKEFIRELSRYLGVQDYENNKNRMQNGKPIGLQLHTAFAFAVINMIIVRNITKNNNCGPSRDRTCDQTVMSRPLCH
jgi:hypothetical protein